MDVKESGWRVETCRLRLREARLMALGLFGIFWWIWILERWSCRLPRLVEKKVRHQASRSHGVLHDSSRSGMIGVASGFLGIGSAECVR